MNRPENGSGMGGRGMGGRGNGQCLRDETGFASGSWQGRRRCRFETGDERRGFPARNPIGFHPFAGAISRIEAAIDDIRRQFNDLRPKV